MSAMREEVSAGLVYSGMASTMPTHAQACPKILKRPAQFSKHTHDAAAVAIDAPETEMVAVASVSSNAAPWQDDARFAIALLVIVVMVNVMAIYFLSVMQTNAAIAVKPKEKVAVITASLAPEPSDAQVTH